MNSNDEDSWLKKEIVLGNLCRYPEVMFCYTKVLEINPRSEIASCVHLGNPDKYQEAIEAHKNFSKCASPEFEHHLQNRSKHAFKSNYSEIMKFTQYLKELIWFAI